MFLSRWVNVPSMAWPALLALLAAIRSLLWSRAQLQAEVLALRHQLLVQKRQCAERRIPFSDLRPGALVLAFAPLAGMASRTPPCPPGDRGPLAPTRLPPVLALGQPIAVPWTSQRFEISSSRCIVRIPPGVLPGSMASSSSLASACPVDALHV